MTFVRWLVCPLCNVEVATDGTRFTHEGCRQHLRRRHFLRWLLGWHIHHSRWRGVWRRPA